VFSSRVCLFGKLQRKKRLVIYRHIIRERRTRFWREVEEDALKLAFVAEHLARTTKKRKESDDGHYSGGFWVVDLDETRPRSARVLLVLGKDILEEGATSTTRISPIGISFYYSESFSFSLPLSSCRRRV